MTTIDRGTATGEPVICGAQVVPGHDGQAELVVHVCHANGGVDHVTLSAASAERLLQRCRVSAIEQLRGQSWQHLLSVMY